MKLGEILVFKVYSNWEIKKLFKMQLDNDKAYFEEMQRVRNRLIHQRRNVGRIYVVQQHRYGITINHYPKGIPENGYDANQVYHDYDQLDFIIKHIKRN